MKNFLYAGCIAVLLSACGGGGTTQVKGDNGASQDVPDFAMAPRVGCATGSGKFRGDFNFSRDMAATNARAELGKSIQTKLEGLYKQYRAEGEAQEKDFTEEQSTKALRELLDIKLTGTRLTKTTSLANNVWVEVCIDPKTIEAYIQNMKSLSESQRRGLQLRAKESFNELDDALDRNQPAQ